MGLISGGILDAIFPRRCQACQTVIAGDRPGWLCPICEVALHPIDGPACPVCGEEYCGSGGDHTCPGCRKNPPPFEKTFSAFCYGGSVKDMITAFKYGRRLHAGEELIRMSIRNGTAARAAAGCDMAVPVPMHWSRLLKRTFNQAALIAKSVSENTGIEFVPGLLTRKRNTPPQATCDRDERAKNVVGAFAVRRPSEVSGKTILLIDDVMTTGATASECTKALLQAGAKSVRVFTLARTTG